MSAVLPARADLGQLRSQAKELRRAVVGGNPAALKRAPGADPATFTLRDAQVVVAREYGFPGWHDLVAAVGRKRVAERDLHRWFGVALRHARRCAELVHGHPDEVADWDRPLAEEVLARAYAANGAVEDARRHWAHAEELAAEVADPENRMVVARLMADSPDRGISRLVSEP